MGGLSRNDVKKALKDVFRVRTWRLIVVLVPLMFVAATLLRLDHMRMTDLREEVLSADEAGDTERLAGALVDLKTFVSKHIVVNFLEKNGELSLTFGTGPFYLEHQYNRDATTALAAAEEALENDDNPNGNVFKKATDYCDPLAKQYGWGYSKPYFDCIMNELAKYPSMGEIDDVGVAVIPPAGEYRIDLVSPVWYPSWAGWVVLVCLLMSVVIIIRFMVWLALRVALAVMKKR